MQYYKYVVLHSIQYTLHDDTWGWVKDAAAGLERFPRPGRNLTVAKRLTHWLNVNVSCLNLGNLENLNIQESNGGFNVSTFEVFYGSLW